MSAALVVLALAIIAAAWLNGPARRGAGGDGLDV